MAYDEHRRNALYYQQTRQVVVAIPAGLEGRMFTQKEKIVSYFGKNQKWQKIALPKNSYAFNFLGSTLVVYHNPKRKDTFGPKKASIDNMILTYPDKGQVAVQSSIIPSPYSNDIRDGKLARLDIFLK